MGIVIFKKRALIWIVLFILLIIFLNSKYFLRIIYPIHFKEEIYTYAEMYQVDPLLVASLIKVESKFNERAKSKKGAIGLMQIMPTTGDWAAEQMGIIDFEPEMLYDPKVNIQVGTWYLSNLHNEFSGNLNLVIAAYNGGRGRVKQWLDYGVWDGREESISNIPYNETRNFVEKVLYNYRRYENIYDKQ